jgi:hypothetical protein
MTENQKVLEAKASQSATSVVRRALWQQPSVRKVDAKDAEAHNGATDDGNFGNS